MLRVTINGEMHELEADSSLADAVAAVSGPLDGRGMAAALDGQVIPRGQWSTTKLGGGARVELVVAVQGG